MSNDTSKFIALAAIGVMAYVVMVKRPAAQVSTPAQLPAAQGVTTPDRSGLYNLAGNLLGRFLGSGSAGSGSTWQTGGVANNPSAYLASSALDGVAYNPPANSPFEAAYISAVGVPSFEVDEGWKLFQ